MRPLILAFALLAAASAWAHGLTAEELAAKNIQAKGGLEKIKAIKSLRLRGRLQQQGFTAQIGQEAKAPNLLKETFTTQGMTQIQAYDGGVGWQISPFQGRKDPELLGEDDLRGLVEDADFYGPLVDYKAKGETLEYLGLDSIDGDDVHRLKVTLKNGDIIYYYLDPDTFLEIRTEKLEFLRGSVVESVNDLGSYKKVNGVYFPFSSENRPKSDPENGAKITIESMEANVEAPDAEFKMPAAPAREGKR